MRSEERGMKGEECLVIEFMYFCGGFEKQLKIRDYEEV